MYRCGALSSRCGASTFATVITMLWWFYLQSIITLLGAQLNVVLTQRLHPRGLVEVPTTEAVYRAKTRCRSLTRCFSGRTRLLAGTG
jgi:hypothetical protein